MPVAISNCWFHRVPPENCVLFRYSPVHVHVDARIFASSSFTFISCGGLDGYMDVHFMHIALSQTVLKSKIMVPEIRICINCLEDLGVDGVIMWIFRK